MLRDIMTSQELPGRQIRLAIFNLEKLDTHPTHLRTAAHEER